MADIQGTYRENQSGKQLSISRLENGRFSVSGHWGTYEVTVAGNAVQVHAPGWAMASVQSNGNISFTDGGRWIKSSSGGGYGGGDGEVFDGDGDIDGDGLGDGGGDGDGDGGGD
mmetsp:Transcript_56616/g.109300  ORF Transcript_56616/g.109300 Transcript_56616/m.109300 type:complete len:114 (-) Transcript_56616:138-479(-)